MPYAGRVSGEGRPGKSGAAEAARTGAGEAAPAETLRTLSLVSYGLQAAGFFVGLTWIAALVLDLLRRAEARGSWLESHFRWRIRTFWLGLPWAALGMLLAPLGVGWLVLLAVTAWAVYRVVRGLLHLSEGRPVPD